ncbi:MULTISPECIES: phage tail sheath C-terminal domain-containing protein [Chromobacterium]|uniref:phage tail sheath family protein n=1 Tax=Chromobacterium TaxID=535 RepID=UPI001D05E6DD|nr:MULTISPECIES: phage tail sheath C-terminal domain-containing protein [Chromobacterium]UJB32735.1 phage tail sheath family protein [Chromobacterium sp. Beijing]
MTTVTSYPGVYIEELPSQSLSIANSSTAVPAIASSDAMISVPTRIASWLEFMNIVSAFDPTKNLHLSVKTYFENGGGYCYVIPTGQLEQEVPKLDDVTLLVAAGEDIKTAATTLCVDGKSLFAILDGPKVLQSPATDMSSYPVSEHAAAYSPWLDADWTEASIPPSGAVAGAYCRVDRERGAWKAPANVALNGGLRPQFKVSDATQGEYNAGKALNMIREFQNNGTLIWGARTLTSNTDTEWRYIPVRRLFNSAEKDIKTTMRSMVFEPNNHATWERVRCAIDNYLRSLWRQGALPGKSEKEAYFVLVGKDITMTDDDIAQGKLIVKIGMAAVRPAEFIILQFTQDVNQG